MLCLALGPNLKTLASADAKGNVLLWPIGPAHTNYDLSESEPLPLTGHVGSVTGVGYLQVSKQLRLFTASTDRTLRVRVITVDVGGAPPRQHTQRWCHSLLLLSVAVVGPEWRAFGDDAASREFTHDSPRADRSRH